MSTDIREQKSDLSDFLGDTTDVITYRLCYTFNYPRNLDFKKKNFDEQEILYERIVRCVKRYLKYEENFKIMYEQHYFEEAGGYKHIHGYIDMTTLTEGSMLGLLNGLCRYLEYSKLIPVCRGRINSWDKADWQVYERHTVVYCPAYCFKLNMDQSPEWEKYIQK
ncbi:hypothetical protein P6U18_21070, partial [Pseudomonas sp. L01]|nr:hypothetical protein [Pseudomonas sp. L01]